MTNQTRMTNDETGKFGIRKFGIDSSFWFRHSGFLLLGLILILAATLRIHRAGQTTLCFDEVWHLAISTGNGSPHMVLPTDVLITDAPSPTSLAHAKPVWEVWGNIQRALHPPLYFVSLHIWRSLFGPSDFAAQSLSILCSLIMLTLVFDFARLRFGDGTALLACAILAVAPMEIFLHQQTRGYAMLQMFGMGALCALSRIEIRGFTKVRGIALLLTTLAMMLTHYFAVAACLAIGLYVLTLFNGPQRKFGVLSLSISALLYAILWGPFIPAQLHDVATTADTFLKENRPDHLVETIKRLLLLPAQQLFNLSAESTGFVLPISAIALFACFLGIRQPRTRLPLFFLAGTFGFVALLDLTRSTTHLLFVRYTMLGLPVILVLLIVGMKQLLPYVACIASGLLIAACLIIGAKTPLIREEPDWDRMRSFLASHIEPGEPIVFSSGDWATFCNQLLYLKSAHYSSLFPHDMVLLTHPMDGALLNQLKSAKSFWLISPPVEWKQWAPGTTEVETIELAPNAMCYRLKIP